MVGGQCIRFSHPSMPVDTCHVKLADSPIFPGVALILGFYLTGVSIWHSASTLYFVALWVLSVRTSAGFFFMFPLKLPYFCRSICATYLAKSLFFRAAIIKLFSESPSAIFQALKNKSISLASHCLDILLVLCVGALA